MINMEVVRKAMHEKMQVLAFYHRAERLLCPHVLGVDEFNRYKCLFVQFGGYSKGMPVFPPGQWRCMYLDELINVRVREGPWHWGPIPQGKDLIAIEHVLERVARPLGA